MPKAYTLEEKKEIALAKQAEAKEEAQTPAPASNGATRRKRGVFNGTQSKISVNHTIPGYHLHVFTDTGGRVQEALDGGYEFVTPDEVGGVGENVVSRNGDLGERVRYLVNPRAEGSEQYGYLMKIRSEWFEEDQTNLQKRNDMIDASIKRGQITGENPAFYIPQGGISVKQ